MASFSRVALWCDRGLVKSDVNEGWMKVGKWPDSALQEKYSCEFILKGNYFSFNGQPYLQTHGTAMGTPLAPNFANIFMSVIEQNILSTAPEGKIPLIWKRFIDDIFMIWQYDEASLTEFLAHTNNVHNTIKFEAQQSKAKINFLDTTIYLNNNSGLLESTLFVKPTDICTPLHAKSFHPPSCKKVLFTAKHFTSDV